MKCKSQGGSGTVSTCRFSVGGTSEAEKTLVGLQVEERCFPEQLFRKSGPPRGSCYTFRPEGGCTDRGGGGFTSYMRRLRSSSPSFPLAPL